MGRKLLIRQNQFPYHICTRSNHKDWFQLPMIEVWKITIDAINKADLKTNKSVIIHAFVLMSNHYHLLITTPESNIDKFMFFFNQEISKHLRQRTNLINRMFGTRYRWSIIDNQNYVYRVVRYIFQNPIRALECESAEQYPYSSLFFQVNDLEIGIRLTNLFDLDLHWINHCDQKESSAIKKGLSRTNFDFHPFNNR